MEPEFILPEHEQFTIAYALPAAYRGRVLRGASVVTASGPSGTIVVQTYRQPLYTIRLKEFTFLQNITLLFTQTTTRIFAALALKNNIRYSLQGIGVLTLKEGQFTVLQQSDGNFSGVYEKDKTYRSLEIDWAEEIVRESIDLFPKLTQLLYQHNPLPAFIGRPAYTANADLLGVANDIVHPPYATMITGMMFDYKIREFYLLISVAIGRVPALKVKLTPEQEVLIDEIAQMLRSGKNKKYPIAQLATTATMNTMKFKQAFKERYDSPPFEYQMTHRMQEAYDILKEGSMNINEVARYIGYKGATSFTTKFREYFGFPPSKITKEK